LNIVDRISASLDRLLSYSPVDVAVELLVIGLIIWLIVRFVKGTRAAGALRGIFVLTVLLVLGAVILRAIGGASAYPRLTYLTNGLFQVAILAMVVVFQPELRRAMIRLGESIGSVPFFRPAASDLTHTVDAIVDASGYLSKARFGALIVIQRQVGLEGLTEGGTLLNASVSARLLQTIFFPGSALHDLAVIVRDGRVHAAGVQLPLAEADEMPDPSLGSRHRAAVGLTRECDALVVVVSEETGRVRMAERGRLSKTLDAAELRETLMARLSTAAPESGVPDADDGAESSFEESGADDVAARGAERESRARAPASRRAAPQRLEQDPSVKQT